MMVKDVTKFHKSHLGGGGGWGGGWSILECVCRVSYRIFSCWWEGTPKFGVEVVDSTYYN